MTDTHRLPAAFSHVDEKGAARMVDVSDKTATVREAAATGFVKMAPGTLILLKEGAPKGDVLAAARIAGIMAAKRTADLIPLCHNIPLDAVKLELEIDPARGGVFLKATACCTGKTGVEMEALTAVSVAALTIYDMCKAVDRSMEITAIRLLRKTGGRSGTFRRDCGGEGTDHAEK